MSNQDKNFKWITKNFDELVKKYNNKWVAVCDEKVVGVEKSLTALKKKLENKYKTDDTVFEFITNKKFPGWDV